MVGMCCVEGPMTSIPGEVVVGQPRGSNKNRGTSKGSWMLTEWGETWPIPGEGRVSQPPGRFATERRPAAPKHENEHTVEVMFGNILLSLRFPRISIEKSPESFRHESFSH